MGALAPTFALALVASACAGANEVNGGSPVEASSPKPDLVASQVLVDRAAFPAAMAATPDGGILFGERLTGDIRRVSPEGEVSEAVAHVEVSTDGEQRGLLGLTVDAKERIVAAWTDVDPDRTLLVGQVAPGPIEILWRGPPTAERANGGRIALWRADGDALLVGVGNLLDPAAAARPDTPNGKFVIVDRGSGPAQRPATLSAGWNNPFAFTVTSKGAVWVADNAGGEGAERLARADEGPMPTRITQPLQAPHSAPSGLAALDEDTMLLCTYGTRELQEWSVVDREARFLRTLADDCSLGVIVLADGRVAYANEQQIRMFAPE